MVRATQQPKKRRSMNHDGKTLSLLSAETLDILRKSEALAHKENLHRTDFIDQEIQDALARINTNPLLVTTGSCSGHDGMPFVSVVFKNEKARDYYVRKFRRLGFAAVKSNDFRLDYYTQYKDGRRVKEEWNFFKRNKCNNAQAKKYWETWEELFSAFPRGIGKIEFIDLDRDLP